DGYDVRDGERAPVYTVHPWVMTSLDKDLLALRDKTVLGVEPSKVASAEVDSSGKQFTLRRAAGGKWDLVEDGTTSVADVPVVERFLDQARDLKGNTIVMDPVKNPEMFGLDQPALTVTLHDKDGK